MWSKQVWTCLEVLEHDKILRKLKNVRNVFLHPVEESYFLVCGARARSQKGINPILRYITYVCADCFTGFCRRCAKHNLLFIKSDLVHKRMKTINKKMDKKSDLNDYFNTIYDCLSALCRCWNLMTVSIIPKDWFVICQN